MNYFARLTSSLPPRGRLLGQAWASLCGPDSLAGLFKPKANGPSYVCIQSSKDERPSFSWDDAKARPSPKEAYSRAWPPNKHILGYHLDRTLNPKPLTVDPGFSLRCSRFAHGSLLLRLKDGGLCFEMLWLIVQGTPRFRVLSFGFRDSGLRVPVFEVMGLIVKHHL